MKTNIKMAPGKSWQFTLGAVFAFLLISASGALSEEQKPPVKPIEISATQTEMPDSRIFFGRWTEKIKNPYCLDISEIIKGTDEYKKVQKEKKPQGTAKYWILMAHASDVARQRIIDFARAKNIDFICDRKTLLAILKRQPEFSGKTEVELMMHFDLTGTITKFREKLDQLLAEKRKSGKGLGLNDKADSIFIERMDPENPVNKTDTEIIIQFDLINKAAETIPLP